MVAIPAPAPVPVPDICNRTSALTSRIIVFMLCLHHECDTPTPPPTGAGSTYFPQAPGAPIPERASSAVTTSMHP